MNVSMSGDTISVLVTEREYHIIMASLRELVAEMHEKDFLTRIGKSRDEVSDIAQQFFDASVLFGIEE